MSIPTNSPKIDAKIEPLRRLHAALSVSCLFNAGRADELAELVHPDVTVLSVPGVAPGAGYAGRAGLLRYFDEAAEHGFVAHAAITEAHVTEAGKCSPPAASFPRSMTSPMTSRPGSSTGSASSWSARSRPTSTETPRRTRLGALPGPASVGE